MRTASLLLLLTVLCPAAFAEVRVSEGTLDLPTDEESAPDVNPPFDLFVTRFNYPYTLRETFTGRQTVVHYRTLELENEYLKVVVLPELGGHLYTCVDKSNGAEMFYANKSIRKANIGYRGAWAAYGVEFNFPVSHNWVSMSPVDYSLARNPDGSGSIWVGNVDRPYGMQWRVELRLTPGSALLEQHVALYNPSAVRHRFYWWNNAGVRVRDDSRIHYPMRWTASHGFREVDTWPVDAKGIDLSLVGNHLDGPVSVFSHGSREAFMGVYHPWSEAGVVHYSSPEDAPTKKIWSFGGDADGIDWRRALSDDQSAYVEVQAGLFRNQETYGFLEPQESIRFAEYWMPVRGIGGITRANPEGVVRLTRTPGKAGTVDVSMGVNVNRPSHGGTLRLKDGASVVYSEALDLTPSQSLVRVRRGLPSTARYTLEVADGSGKVLLAHTEDQWDYAPESAIRLGRQPSFVTPPVEKRSDGAFVDLGDTQERDGKLPAAWETYRLGLQRFPDSFGLLKAAGRLAVGLKRPEEAVPFLTKALATVSNDSEAQYYLGLAYGALGDDAKAKGAFEGAQILARYRAPARLELARLDARGGDVLSALARVRALVGESLESVGAGAVEVALLRRLDRGPEARERLAHWRSLDPTSNLLRNEAQLLGADEPDLWRHLAGDPDRVLGLAEEYLALGFYADALSLLERRYPTDSVMAESGNTASAGQSSGGLLPWLFPRTDWRLRDRRLSRGVGDVDALRLPEPPWHPGRPARRPGSEPEGRRGSLPLGLSPPLGRSIRRGDRRMGGDPASRPEDPRPPPQSRHGAPPRAEHPGCGTGRLRRGARRGRGEHGALRRCRSGPEPPRPPHRGARGRRSSAIPIGPACRRLSSRSSRWLWPRRDAATRPRPFFPAAAFPARRTAPTCGRSTSRCVSAGAWPWRRRGRGTRPWPS